jgi:hypothetical protein
MTWLHNNSSRRMSPSDLSVKHEAHPDWISGTDRIPTVGEQVYCTSGLAEVVKLLGKTSDGSRLLELKLPDTASKPFFAAASNVLVAPAAPVLC